MKLEKFTTIKKTLLSKSTRYSFFSALLLLLNFGQASAQCPLGCNNNVQISLDGDCSVEVTPDMVLEGQGDSGCDYTVVILGSNGQPINTPMGPNGGPTVTGAYIGQTLTAEVRLGSNSCWGYISIEDKLAPTINCMPDITVSCYESSTLAIPSATDNCDNNVDVELLSDNTVDLDCSDEFSAVRTYIYQAEDDSGNKSELCTRRVYLERIGLDGIVFPRSKDDVEDASYTCGPSNTVAPAWDTNGDGYPQPSESGTPTTTDGFNIFPNNSYCELNVTYNDDTLHICESSFKVLRKWTVLDWCTGEIATDYQIVKVLDNAAPIVTCAPDIVEDGGGLSADPYTCTADWEAIPPTVVFDCSSTTYTVSYLLADATGGAPENGFYITDNVYPKTVSDNYEIRDLPLGRTWIKYTITDACGNSTDCFTEVDVIDDVPPVPVCDEFTVATLTNGGFARIFAETFDDGSHDNCTSVGFEVSRMTPATGCSDIDINEFGPYVDFCCSDVDKVIMVALKVWDDANGSGIYGDVVSKIIDTNGSGQLGDVVNGIPDETIDFEDNYNICMVEVRVDDKIDPVIECPVNITVDCGTDLDDLSIVGKATASDNCGDVEVEYGPWSLNDCGTGTVNRVWRVVGTSVTCTQRITVEDFTPFNQNNNEITWPGTRNLTGCMNVDTEPSSTGTPSYSGDQCSQLADTYEDQVFTFVDDACFKILRTWTVIDWCQFDQNNPGYGGIWQHTQIIKVNNSIAPEIVGCNNGSMPNNTVDAFGADCNGFAEIIIEATDECTPVEELEFTYELDEDNDGSINYNGNTNDASRTLDVGTHKIYWTVEDRCGNLTACEQLIIVRDRKKPTPYCLSEITTVIMPSTDPQMIEIWASDFDLGSEDNCPGELRFSFSSNTSNTNMQFFCEDVGLQLLDIWVTDASGNQDFCTTQINIQSNGGCDGSRIGGDISSENNKAVEEVTVSLEHMTTHETSSFITPTSGHYQFIDVEAGADYELRASKDGDYRNGVNTLDIVKVQRHLLGLESLDSPYKIIAADANGDEKIRPSDLLTIRKLILGLSTDFGSDSESWKFVGSNHTFADTNDPFPIDDAQVVEVNDFFEIDTDNHFMAIKVGDVDMSAEGNLVGEGDIESRSGNTLRLSAVNASYEAGDLVSIPVTVANAAQVVGMQFTLETAGLNLESYSEGAIKLTNENLAEVNSNTLTISWNELEAQSYAEGEVLFVLNFTAQSAGSIAEAMKITSNVTIAEAYDADLNTVDVAIEVRDTNVDASEFELKQNTPNPFVDNTIISFNLPTSGEATLKVYSITGQSLAQYSGNFNKGINEITVNSSDLSTTGVMYYQLEFAGKVATRKMISIAR